MKALLIAALCLIGSSAMASAVDYACIADTLDAKNSDIYYDLSKEQIDSMLSIPEYMGHIDALNAKRSCEEKYNERKAYKCVAEGLEAINSDIYYNLTKEEINTMLSNPESFGHLDATNVARRCNLRF